MLPRANAREARLQKSVGCIESAHAAVVSCSGDLVALCASSLQAEDPCRQQVSNTFPKTVAPFNRWLRIRPMIHHIPIL